MSRRGSASLSDGRTDRGVSEVVAFVLVFGIVLSSVALLSMTGFQAMEEYQENEQLRNAERAVSALAENFNDVLRYDAIDERYGELALREGTVATGDDGTKLNVSVDHPDADSTEFGDLREGVTVDLGEFRYESGSETIAYDGGAVVRASDSASGTNSVVLERPHLRYSEDTNTAVVTFAQINATNRSIQSSENQGFTITVENRTAAVYEDDTEFEVNISLEESPYEDAWDDILEEDGDWQDGIDVEQVVITIVEVDIEY